MPIYPPSGGGAGEGGGGALPRQWAVFEYDSLVGQSGNVVKWFDGEYASEPGLFTLRTSPHEVPEVADAALTAHEPGLWKATYVFSLNSIDTAGYVLFNMLDGAGDNYYNNHRQTVWVEPAAAPFDLVRITFDHGPYWLNEGDRMYGMEVTLGSTGAAIQWASLELVKIAAG